LYEKTLDLRLAIEAFADAHEEDTTCLDVDRGRVVKGIRFQNLRDAGDPVEQALAYERQGADEIVFLDITASSDRRDTVLDMVKRTAYELSIPFTVGGGIRGYSDVRKVLLAGADKVSLNTSAVLNPNVISEGCGHLR